MRYLQSHIGQRFTAIIFSLLILFPIGIQAAHGFEFHEHENCLDFSNHMHQEQLDCTICDFHFSTFQFSSEPLPIPFKELVFHKSESFILLHEANLTLTHYFLRAPPSILVYS